MWVIDIRSWLVEKETETQDSALKDKVEKVREIITHATGSAAGKPAESPPMCWRKFEGNPCKGKLVTRLDQGTDQIYWKCPVCQDEGVITGWRGLIQDVLKNPEKSVSEKVAMKMAHEKRW